MWHIYINGDSSSPHVFEDQNVMHQFISTITAGTPFIVRKFDVMLRTETVYNLTGSPPLPTAPNPPITITNYQLNHYKKG